MEEGVDFSDEIRGREKRGSIVRGCRAKWCDLAVFDCVMFYKPGYLIYKRAVLDLQKRVLDLQKSRIRF